MSLNNLTPSQAYNEYLLNLKEDFDDDLNFHLQKEDRSKCSRRRNFNSLYVKYCQEHFEGKNGPEMFCNLEERIKNCLDTHKDVKIDYQVYDGGAALILMIITLLLIRMHQKVYVLVDKCRFFFLFLYYFFTTVVLRFFEYVPKSSFQIKLDGTHYEFTVALRLCHIFFILDLTVIRTCIYRFNVES